VLLQLAGLAFDGSALDLVVGRAGEAAQGPLGAVLAAS
jgi:hypothetical protein